MYYRVFTSCSNMSCDGTRGILCPHPKPSENTIVATGLSEEYKKAHRIIYKHITSAMGKDTRIKNIQPVGKDVWITLDTPEQARRVIDFLHVRNLSKARPSTDKVHEKSSHKNQHFPGAEKNVGPTQIPQAAQDVHGAKQKETHHKTNHDQGIIKDSFANDSRKRRQEESNECDIGSQKSANQCSYIQNVSSSSTAMKQPVGGPSASIPRDIQDQAQEQPADPSELDDIENQLLMNNHFFEISMIGKKSLRETPRQVAITSWGKYACSEILLYQLCSPFGAIWSVKVESPRRGIVTFVHPGSCSGALHSATMDGLFVNNNRLEVTIIAQQP